MTVRKGITAAYGQPDLPGYDWALKMEHLRIQRLFAERAKTPEQDNARSPSHPQGNEEKSMVEQDRPHPAPRPSPGFAADIDAASFNARWEAERLRATQSHSPQPNQGERPMSDDKTPQRPAETVREGPLKAAIWRNENESGVYHSVSLSRTYKDREGNLQDTSSFRPKDMLSLSELARRAHHSAGEHEREAFKEMRQAEQYQAQSQSQDKGMSK